MRIQHFHSQINIQQFTTGTKPFNPMFRIIKIVNLQTHLQDVQQWLNSNIVGVTVGEVFSFYGYYVMVQVNGSNYGMLSANGYSGKV